jgi:hypothetical protein
MNKFKEIIEAWRIKWNPTEQQKILSEKRLEICAGCPSRNELIKESHFWVVCGECGCALEAKAHSPVKGACPLGKWEIVDEKYLKP